MEVFARTLMQSEGFKTQFTLSLSKNIISTEDSIFDLGFESFFGFFFKIGSVLKQEYIPEIDPGCIYTTVYRLQSTGLLHKRSVYGLMGLIGDLGGVTEVVMILFGFFLYPISEFEFNLEAMKTLFMARTSDPNLMDKQCKSFTAKPEFKIPKH